MLLLMACGSGTPTPAPPARAPTPPTARATAEPADAGPTPHERALQVHRDAIVVDAHCDTAMRITDSDVDIGVRGSDGHIDLVRMAEGGLDMQVFAIWVDPGFGLDRAQERAVRMIDATLAALGRHPEKVGLARTVAEARGLVSQGKIAAWLGIEGGIALEDDPAALAMFHRRGVRYLTLTWWDNNNWADGSGDKPRWHGLNELGRTIVHEMDRLGIAVDVSHASDETFWDVIETTSKPIIASHSNARALCDHHRNMTDEMLRALATNGGVVGVNFVAGFLDEDFKQQSSKLWESLEPELDELKRRYANDPVRSRQERWGLYSKRATGLEPVPLDRVIDHIDHIVQVAGVDHVGLGSDFDGFVVGASGLEDCSRLPAITEKLLARGYSEQDVRQILGGNFLRVFEQVIGQ